MRLLFDTNILIPLEPTATEHVEETTAVASELVGLAQGSHFLFMHPASFQDLANDGEADRRQARVELLRKYRQLEHPLPPSEEMETVLGRPATDSHDFVDHQLLAAVYRDAVHLLVTEDDGIHRKARRLGIPERVLRIRDAIETLRALLVEIPAPPPFVLYRPAHALDDDDPLFDSFRQEYENFDPWLAKCKLEERPAWVIQAGDGTYAGLVIIKEHDDEYGTGERICKICSFKVGSKFQGNKYGELLLKTIFNYCADLDHDSAWITVFPHHKALIELLQDFGFRQRPECTDKNELIFVKRFAYQQEDRKELGPLAFHIEFGPPALKATAQDIHLVPIQPHFHELLFPEVGPQLTLPLASPPPPFGNALRKAYLCRAATRQLQRGSSLVFYRSDDLRAATCIGVVESVLVSTDPAEIATFVGQRTVYSLDEITEMSEREVLVILFRQDRFLDPPVPADELIDQGVINRAPQTIMRARPEGAAWLAAHING